MFSLLSVFVSLILTINGQGTKGGSSPSASILRPTFGSSSESLGFSVPTPFIAPPPAPAPEPVGAGPDLDALWGPPKPYSFGYEAAGLDGRSSRQETSDGRRVTGSYTLAGADGINRVVHYVADADGFRASVITNEPGTERQNPSGVIMESSQPPAPELAQQYGPGPVSQYLGAAANVPQTIQSFSQQQQQQQEQIVQEEFVQRPAQQQQQQALPSFVPKPVQQHTKSLLLPTKTVPIKQQPIQQTQYRYEPASVPVANTYYPTKAAEFKPVKSILSPVKSAAVVQEKKSLPALPQTLSPQRRVVFQPALPIKRFQPTKLSPTLVSPSKTAASTHKFRPLATAIKSKEAPVKSFRPFFVRATTTTTTTTTTPPPQRLEQQRAETFEEPIEQHQQVKEEALPVEQQQQQHEEVQQHQQHPQQSEDKLDITEQQRQQQQLF